MCIWMWLCRDRYICLYAYTASGVEYAAHFFSFSSAGEGSSHEALAAYHPSRHSQHKSQNPLNSQVYMQVYTWQFPPSSSPCYRITAVITWSSLHSREKSKSKSFQSYRPHFSVHKRDHFYVAMVCCICLKIMFSCCLCKPFDTAPVNVH